MPRVLLGLVFTVLAAVGASHTDAQSLQCEVCEDTSEVDIGVRLEVGVYRNDEVSPAPSRHDVMVAARAELLQEREEDIGSPGWAIFAGGFVGLAGLGGAAGVIAAWEQLLILDVTTHPDGSVTEDTSVGLALGLLAVTGLIALGGLFLFVNGIGRRGRRTAIDEEIRLLDQQLSFAAHPLWW